MSYEAAGLEWGQEVASEDLSAKQYHIVKLAAGGIAVAAAATDNPIGVLRRNANLNEVCDVRIVGIAEVKAGAAVAKGAEVMSDAAGKAITYAAGANNMVVGIALKAAAADGDIIPVLLGIYDGPDA